MTRTCKLLRLNIQSKSLCDGNKAYRSALHSRKFGSASGFLLRGPFRLFFTHSQLASSPRRTRPAPFLPLAQKPCNAIQVAGANPILCARRSSWLKTKKRDQGRSQIGSVAESGDAGIVALGAQICGRRAP